MRIAIFTETFLPKVDGIVTRLRNTVTALRRSGHDVLIFAPEGGIREFQGACVMGMPAVPFPLYPELKLAMPRPAMRKTLEAFQPDIVHAVDPSVLGIAGIYYASTMNIPLVVSYHTQLPKYLHFYKLGWSEPYVWKLVRLRHNKAAVNLCTSSAMVDDLTLHGIDRVNLWQRGIDTEQFRPCRPADELSSMRDYLSEGHPDAPLLLYVGRLSAEKNIEQLRPILAAIPGARLALVGGGPHRVALLTHFAGTPTFFAGYLEGERLAEAFSAADVFMLTSRTETLGLVLLEAMAAGCPSVAARAGGIPDIIEDGRSGFLFDTEAEAIASVRVLLDDRDRRDSIRQAARVEAERWSWTAATRQLEMYYHMAASYHREVQAPEKLRSNPHPLKLMAERTTIGVIRRVLR